MAGNPTAADGTTRDSPPDAGGQAPSHNAIWTGAGDDQVALVYVHGTVFCNGRGLKTLVVRYLPRTVTSGSSAATTSG